MWGNNFFSSTVYLSVLLGCGSIMDIFWDFRILPGSNLNQEKFTSADSECQGPVRILREGVGLKYGFHVSIDTFFLADKSLLNLIFFFFFFWGSSIHWYHGPQAWTRFQAIMIYLMGGAFSYEIPSTGEGHFLLREANTGFDIDPASLLSHCILVVWMPRCPGLSMAYFHSFEAEMFFGSGTKNFHDHLTLTPCRLFFILWVGRRPVEKFLPQTHQHAQHMF